MTNRGDARLYSDRVITKIVAATGQDIPPERCDELMARLEQAAENLRLRRILHQEPTARMLRDKFIMIERAANNLLDELGAGPAGALSTIPKLILDQLQLAAIKKAKPIGKSGYSLLQGSVAGVVQLKRWSKKLASSAAERESKRIELSGVKKPRRSKDQTLKYWINDLSVIYRDIWEREPRLHWNAYTETCTGGFFKFVRSAGDAIGVDKSDHALGMAIRRAKNMDN